MRINWMNILFVMILILSIGVFYSSNHKNNSRLIDNVNVTITPKTSYFISADSIENIVLKYVNKLKDSITLSLIENEIDKNTFVSKSEVFTGVGQDLFVNIMQKDPIARLITKDSIFYLDKNSKFMSLSKLQSVNVPILLGYGDKGDLEFLTKLCLQIREDSFLKENVSKIIIKDHKISLKLRGYQSLVLVGNNIRLEKKIQNLKAFYMRAKEENNLNDYKEVNLQFENQVVAIKK